MKHTPGPWFIKPVSNATVEGNLNIIQTESSTGKGYHVSYSAAWDDNEVTKIEAQANANLIAAAPDLLEALQEVVKVLDGAGCEAATVKAKAAISKALGGGVMNDFYENDSDSKRQEMANDATLRDYFAAKAMQAIISNPGMGDVNVAQMAYGIADTMLSARE